MTRRGGVLLEVMVAIAVFVMAALAVLASLNDGVGRARRIADAIEACDVARSAMSRLEAGLVSVESLQGPAPIWMPELDLEGFDDVPEVPNGWELRIATNPSAFEGLTEVAITAVLTDPRNPGAELSSYTLVQLVRLREDPEDSIGGEDEITERARRARPRNEGGPPG